MDKVKHESFDAVFVYKTEKFMEDQVEVNEALIKEIKELREWRIKVVGYMSGAFAVIQYLIKHFNL